MLEAHKTWKQTQKLRQIYAETAFDILSKNKNKKDSEEKLKKIFVYPKNVSQECQKSWPKNAVRLNTLPKKLSNEFSFNYVLRFSQESY